MCRRSCTLGELTALLLNMCIRARHRMGICQTGLPAPRGADMKQT
jgi:hypothetical protein